MRRSFLALSAGAFLLSGCGARPLEPRDPDPGAFHFKIQTYNLNNDEGGDLETLAAIGAANADVICLQENTAAWQAVIEPAYRGAYPHRMFRNDENGGAAGLAILSRFPLRDAGWHEGPNGWHPAWHYIVDTPNGSFKILNVHLRDASGQNGNTVQSLLRTGADHDFEIRLFTGKNTAELPTVVLGDFNEESNGAAIEYLEGIGFRNVLPLFHPGQPTWRYGRSVGGQFTQALDHILFDSAFDPLNAWVVTEGASDHIPVVAHFQAVRTW